MNGFQKMHRLQKVRNTIVSIIVDEDRTKQSLFHLNIVRGHAVAFFFRADAGDRVCHWIMVRSEVVPVLIAELSGSIFPLPVIHRQVTQKEFLG